MNDQVSDVFAALCEMWRSGGFEERVPTPVLYRELATAILDTLRMCKGPERENRRQISIWRRYMFRRCGPMRFVVDGAVSRALGSLGKPIDDDVA